ncbi:hypothetical protein E2C01_050953 [Portunus trituberculatus]|uniref:Secreted protein n=1 Tax=Portunus trituberculatus TaxID=210409 RepID=A0A5B7GHU9_PORTR|nr:hypothetical protein [Portunus trituberculatus]
MIFYSLLLRVPLLLTPFPRFLTRSQAQHMNKSKSKRVRSPRRCREDPGWTGKYKNPVTRSGLSKQQFFTLSLFFSLSIQHLRRAGWTSEPLYKAANGSISLP